jgi:hypothetical protein
MEKQNLIDAAWRLWEETTMLMNFLEIFFLDEYLAKLSEDNHHQETGDRVWDDIPF